MAYTATQEADLAQESMRRWYKEFPEVLVTVGNHGALPYRQVIASGVPKKMGKSYEEIWEAPVGWKWVGSIEHQDVFYIHGNKRSGMPPAFRASKERGQSVVMGHTHTAAGVWYQSGARRHTFGMNVGCRMDQSRYAFAYSHNSDKLFINGCGVVMPGGKQAHFISMPT